MAVEAGIEDIRTAIRTAIGLRVTIGMVGAVEEEDALVVMVVVVDEVEAADGVIIQTTSAKHLGVRCPGESWTRFHWRLDRTSRRS